MVARLNSAEAGLQDGAGLANQFYIPQDLSSTQGPFTQTESMPLSQADREDITENFKLLPDLQL